MTGPENDVINAAIRVAKVHNACMLERDPEILQGFIGKMEKALEELTDYVMTLELSRADQKQNPSSS